MRDHFSSRKMLLKSKNYVRFLQCRRRWQYLSCWKIHLFIIVAFICLLLCFLRWVVVEKVSSICAWCIGLCTTLCFVNLKLPLFARISHAVTGEETRMFFFIPLLLQIAVSKEGKRQVWCQELVVCLKRQLIPTFKSTQYELSTAFTPGMSFSNWL